MIIIRKFISFFRFRKHYLNRLNKRNGKHIYFLFSKKLEDKYVCDKKSKTKCEVYKFKNNLYFIQNYKMQTYIKK